MHLQTSPFLCKYLSPIKIGVGEDRSTLALTKLIFLFVNLRIYRFPFQHFKILQTSLPNNRPTAHLKEREEKSLPNIWYPIPNLHRLY